MSNYDEDYKERDDLSRIAAAFRELRSLGWFARTNYSCCQTCGFAEAESELAQEDPELNEVKIVFYHNQAHERAFPNGERELQSDLYLSHAGPAYEVVGVLTKYGLQAVWDGNSHHTIRIFQVKRINWK